MSLLGLRDMSVIETPPKDRLAIHTVVAHFEPDLIKTAIEQELGRGGQVYFLHNRVDSIWARAAQIQELVPGCPHRRGPRPDGRGRAGKGDARLHAPRVRRLRVHHHRRERPGYSARQHHDHRERRALRPSASCTSLRGRVGRSNRRAYAYLLVPADTELSETGAQAAGGAEGVQRPGRRVQDRRARSRTARRGQPAGRRAARAHQRRRASTCTCACSRRRCRN